MSRRLLVIGLDGYEASLGDRMMSEGRLPALTELNRRGARLHLDHGAAKRTGLAWEHFSTGLAPEAAQRWSAVEFDPQRYRCVQRGTALEPFPAKLGVKTVVFDPPYFDIARAPGVEGVVGWGAHDPGTQLQSQPSELLEEIRKRFGPYPAQPWIYGFTWPNAARTEQMGRALVDATRLRERIARWLLVERIPDWTLGLVVVSELHSALEALWHGVDELHPLHRVPSAEFARKGVEDTYEAVDALVGSLMRSCPDATILAFSMHGMGTNESDVASMALLPELLYRRSSGARLLETLDEQPQIAAGVPGLGESQDWRTHVRGLYRESSADVGRPARGTLGGIVRSWVPAPMKRWLKRSAPLLAGATTHAIDWMPAAWYSGEWPAMDAFALPSFYDGQIRINLEGREARGRVACADYERVCSELEAALTACIDPRTGRGVVREFVRTRRNDPRHLGPTEADITIVWAGSPLAFAHPRWGTIGPLPYRRTGGHTGAHGIAWIAGADIDPGFHGVRSAFDIAPTIRDYVAGARNLELSGQSFLETVTRIATGHAAG